jgi:hypothetical protein
MMSNAPSMLRRGLTCDHDAHHPRREDDEPDPGNTYQTNSNPIQGYTYWLGHIGDFGPP